MFGIAFGGGNSVPVAFIGRMLRCKRRLFSGNIFEAYLGKWPVPFADTHSQIKISIKIVNHRIRIIVIISPCKMVGKFQNLFCLVRNLLIFF